MWRCNAAVVNCRDKGAPGVISRHACRLSWPIILSLVQSPSYGGLNLSTARRVFLRFLWIIWDLRQLITMFLCVLVHIHLGKPSGGHTKQPASSRPTLDCWCRSLRLLSRKKPGLTQLLHWLREKSILCSFLWLVTVAV